MQERKKVCRFLYGAGHDSRAVVVCTAEFDVAERERSDRVPEMQGNARECVVLFMVYRVWLTL